MFSTANRTSVSSAIRQIPVTKSRAYCRCQRNGGWTTTVRRAELLRGRPGPLELHPRVGGPDPLRDQQTGRVHGEDRHLVVVREPAQRLDVLADGVGPDHDLDAVVAQTRGDLEGRRRRLRIDGGRRQGDLRIRDAHHWFCHGDRVRGGCARHRGAEAESEQGHGRLRVPPIGPRPGVRSVAGGFRSAPDASVGADLFPVDRGRLPRLRRLPGRRPDGFLRLVRVVRSAGWVAG